MSPPSSAVGRLRVATWNVNSVRARLDALGRLLDHAAPDVLCLQETKVAVLPKAAVEAIGGRGYAIVHADRPVVAPTTDTGVPRRGAAYNGVAVLARPRVMAAASSGELGVEVLDREPRVASCVVDVPGGPLRVVSVYVPHGRQVGHWHYDYKLAFLGALAMQVGSWLTELPRLVLCGDVNVAPTDSDVFHPGAFVGLTHVTEPERAAWRRVLDAGLVDVDAARWGESSRRFTWWSHARYPTNLGMRIDVIAADRHTAAAIDTTWIDHAGRSSAAPSDHAALLADFHSGLRADAGAAGASVERVG